MHQVAGYTWLIGQFKVGSAVKAQFGGERQADGLALEPEVMTEIRFLNRLLLCATALYTAHRQTEDNQSHELGVRITLPLEGTERRTTAHGVSHSRAREPGGGWVGVG